MHKAISITRDLVSIPSVNPMGDGQCTGEIYSEKNIAFYIHKFLSRLGVDVEVIASNPDHPIVVGKLDGETEDTIILEAHMDTVSHLNMSIDPFDPKIENGLLYGRGSCDTKASLATYLYAIEYVIKNNLKPKRKIIILAVHDEEYSFGGIKEFVKMGTKAYFAIVGEPTSLNMIYAHKGVCRFWITTAGISSHAALPWLGSNAIYKMAEIINIIRSYAETLKLNQHEELGSATINIGKIIGGVSANIVPAECNIEIDRRMLPGEKASVVISDLKKLIPESLEVSFSKPYLIAPATHTPKDYIACEQLEAACKKAKIKSEFGTAHYATDASVLSSADIPSIVFGPGSIELAHTQNEHILIDQIEKASEIIINLILD